MRKSSHFVNLLIPTGILLGLTLLLAAPLAPDIQAVVPSPTPARAAPPSVAPPSPTPLPSPTPTAAAWERYQLRSNDESPLPTPRPLPESAEVPILMYHYVEPLPPNADRFRRDLTVLPENFEAQLQALADSGYHTVSLTDLYLYLTYGTPLPPKPIILTFDDGYRDAYTIILPLLQQYGFVGTFFVLATPTHYENPNYLTWAMMREMADAGMEIQGHGRDHVDLRGRSTDFLVYQILGIKEAVEYHTGQAVHFFCYPSGQYDDDVIAVARSAGYWGAVTTQYGRVHTREDLFALHRIRVRGTDSLESFMAHVEGR